MPKSLALMVTFLFLGSTLASAKIINVPADSSTIQSGINGAVNGDTVLVAEGDYYELINFHGKSIIVASEFLNDNDTTHIINTVIDGNPDTIGIADTLSVIRFVSGEDTNSVLCGFTVTGGHGTIVDFNSRGRQGGGVFIENSSPKILNNRFKDIMDFGLSDFSALCGGEAIFGKNSSAIVEKNKFIPLIIGNPACFASGIAVLFVDGGSPKITDNIWWPGHVTGISLIDCNPASEISQNVLVKIGGDWAIKLRNTSCQILSNTIADKPGSAVMMLGGAIGCFDASPKISNNIIVRNSAPLYESAGIQCEGTSNPEIIYNDIWGNEPTDFYGTPAGVGDTAWDTNINGTHYDSFYNIMCDPLFCDTASNNYFLSDNSPCINAGEFGHKMGALGIGCGTSVPVADQDLDIIKRYSVSQNYPNPFNSSTAIQYTLSKDCWVDIRIFNILGRKVRTLVDEYEVAGVRIVRWDGRDEEGCEVASGVYLYRLQARDYVQTKKMLLLK